MRPLRIKTRLNKLYNIFIAWLHHPLRSDVYTKGILQVEYEAGRKGHSGGEASQEITTD